MRHFNKYTQDTCVMAYELNGNTYVNSFHWSLRFLQNCSSINTTAQKRPETTANLSSRLKSTLSLPPAQLKNSEPRGLIAGLIYSWYRIKVLFILL